MGNRADLVGKRFGRLVVDSFAKQKRHKSGGTYMSWRCVCDCGNLTDVDASSLVRGITKSCGCLRQQFSKITKTKEGTAFRNLFNAYKCNAPHRKIEFNLTKEEFRCLVSANCFYCGRRPSNQKTARSGEIYVYNGIDRLSALKGYTVDNCTSCCTVCNLMKGRLDVEDFLSCVSKIYKHSVEAA
jgi:hypothetical protein